MKTRNIVLNLMLLLVFVLAACGGAPDAMDKPEDMGPEEAMTEKTAEETMMEKPTEEAIIEAPAWYSVSLTDVNTGEAFTINDLKGKVILVEMMAVWCPKCKTQQGQVKALHDMLGERDDFVSIGIDVDPNEDADKLSSFTTSNGFSWKYVIAPAEVSRDISSLYGGQFLSPPSTPMLIIDRHGIAHPLPFGVKSAEDLLNSLQPFLDEAM